MQERGYHMEAVYDIWDDFMSQMEDEETPLGNPSKWFPEFRWSSERAPEHFHPAQTRATRHLEILASGELLRRPERLDAAYDQPAARGSAFVRAKTFIGALLAMGYWHFPDEPRGPRRKM